MIKQGIVIETCDKYSNLVKTLHQHEILYMRCQMKSEICIGSIDTYERKSLKDYMIV